MFQIVRNISEWGIKPGALPENAYRLRLTNILLLMLFFFSIVQTIVLFINGAKEAALVNSTAPLVFGIGLFMMKLGCTKLARVFVVSICYLGGYAVSAALGPDSYFQFVFLFGSAFSSVFFSVHHERSYFVYALLIPVAVFVGLEISHYQPIFGMTRAAITTENLGLMRIGSTLVIWLGMVLMFAYYVRVSRQSQEQLISTAKMVAMGRMAAGIAHEVNNPLQRIVSHSERLRFLVNSGSLQPDQIVAVSEQIQSVAMRIGAIVRGLLALSRDASNDPPIRVSIGAVIKLSLDYCRARFESHKVELRVAEVPVNWFVVGREAQLSEVFLNVLNNAFDAVLESQSKWVQIETSANDTSLEVFVTDSGPGIAPDLQKRIFDPFFTTKAVGRGTGLGLSVSKGIISDHGGEIFLDPHSKSTRFVIRIPRA